MKDLTFIIYLLISFQICTMTKLKINTQQTLTIAEWQQQNLVQNSNGQWYLMLSQNGPKINYSSNFVPSNKPWGASDTNTVVTMWTGLNINLNTFLVNNGDYTYATSSGQCHHYSITNQVPFGTAFDCAGSGSQTGLAKIDLTGTNWIIDDSWAIGGWQPGGSATLSSNNQIATITGGGYCGWNAPVRANSETLAYTGGPYLKLKLQCRPGDLQVGTDCYAAWTGTPALANGMQFLIQSNFIFDANSRNNDPYVYYLGQSKNGATGTQSGQTAAYVCASADAGDALNVSATPNGYNVFVANNVNGLQASWTFLQNGTEVYWNSNGGCTQPSQFMTLSQNGSQYGFYMYSANYLCQQQIRSYIATDHLQMKADYDGYSNPSIYYFNLLYKYN